MAPSNTLNKDDIQWDAPASRGASAPPDVQWDATPDASLIDKMIGGWGGRMLMGAASPVLAGVQLLGGEKGRQAVADLEDAKKRGMAAEGNSGTDWYGLLGAALPAAKIAKGVTAALPVAQGVLGRAGLGAAQGAAVAMATPAAGVSMQAYAPNKVDQIGAGAIVGGAVPLAIDAAKGLGGVVKQAVEPLYESGRAAILKRFQTSLMGDQPGARDRIIQALANAKPIVPGSNPTAAEALSALPEGTGLAAHQNIIGGMPGLSPQFVARQGEQEAARLAAIQKIGKTPEALAQAVADRADAARLNYGAADTETVLADSRLRTLLARPAMQTAMKDAATNAANRGEPLSLGSGVSLKNLQDMKNGKAISVKDLDIVKKSLDDMIEKAQSHDSKVGKNALVGLQDLKQQFLSWLEDKSSTYQMARQTFEKQSIPINRMQVGHELEKALTNPLGTGERSGVFANAIREAPRTLKKATGQPRYDQLGEVLTAAQTRGAESVASDLARQDAAARLARGTNLAGAEAIPGNVGVTLPNILSRPAMIANYLMRHVGMSAEEKIAKVAAAQYLNPQQLAAGLQEVPSRYQPLLDALIQRAASQAASATARNY